MTMLLAPSQIRGVVHVVRGLEVMFDADLAGLYGVETKVLNQAVRRNRARFPEDFAFQLKSEEVAILRSQSVTSSSETPEKKPNLRSQSVTSRSWGGHRYEPWAFTEQGVAMLSSILGSPRAIQVNIQIMRAFVEMRRRADTHTATSALVDRVAALERRGEAADDVRRALKVAELCTEELEHEREHRRAWEHEALKVREERDRLSAEATAQRQEIEALQRAAKQSWEERAPWLPKPKPFPSVEDLRGIARGVYEAAVRADLYPLARKSLLFLASQADEEGIFAVSMQTFAERMGEGGTHPRNQREWARDMLERLRLREWIALVKDEQGRRPPRYVLCHGRETSDA